MLNSAVLRASGSPVRFGATAIGARRQKSATMTRAWAVAWLASAVLSRVAADGMIRNAEAYWVSRRAPPRDPPPALADPQPP